MDKGLQEVTVVVFLKPDEAVVVFKNGSTTNEKLLEELESDMLNDVRHSLKHELGRFTPRLHQEVMVSNSGNTRCQRGYILDILPTDTKPSYTVFLYDDGVIVKHYGGKILKLKERFQLLPPRFNLFKIPGIVPSKLVLPSMHGMALDGVYQQEYVVGENWSPAAEDWVVGWVKAYGSKACVLVLKEVDRIVKVGELFGVSQTGKIQRRTYSDAICSQKFALSSPSKYSKDVEPEVTANSQTNAQRIGGLLSDAAISKPRGKWEQESIPSSVVPESYLRNATVDDKPADDSDWESLIEGQEISVFSDPENKPVSRKAEELNWGSTMYSEMKKKSPNAKLFGAGISKPSNPFYKQEPTKILSDELQEKKENVPTTGTPAEQIPLFKESTATTSLAGGLFSRLRNSDNCFENEGVVNENRRSQPVLMPDHIHHHLDQQNEHHISMKDAVADMSVEVRDKPQSTNPSANTHTCGKTATKSTSQAKNKLITPEYVQQLSPPRDKIMTPLELARLKRNTSPAIESKVASDHESIAVSTKSADRCHDGDIPRSLPRKLILQDYNGSRFGRGYNATLCNQPSQASTTVTEPAPVQKILRARLNGPEIEKYKREYISNINSEPTPNVHNDDNDRSWNESPLSTQESNASPKPFKVTLGYTWDEAVKHRAALKSQASGFKDLPAAPQPVTSEQPSRIDQPALPDKGKVLPAKINPFRPPSDNGQSKRINPFRSQITSPVQSPPATRVNATINKESNPLKHPESGTGVSGEEVERQVKEIPGTSSFVSKSVDKLNSTNADDREVISSSTEIDVTDSRSLTSPHMEISKKAMNNGNKHQLALSSTSITNQASKDKPCNEENGIVPCNSKNLSQGTDVPGSQLDPKDEPSVVPTTEGTVVFQSTISSYKMPYEGANLKKIVKEGVFMYGNSPVAPYSDMEFPYLNIVKKALFQNFLKKFNSLQKHVIPNILRGRNVFILDRNNNGKSLSYLIPIVAKIMVDSNQKGRDSQGPVAVIVSSSLSSCVSLGNDMQILLQSTQQKYTLGYCVTQNDQTTKRELAKGVDILVTTPELLLEMMDNYLPYIALDRLMYLVVDDLEILTNTKIQVLHDVLKQIEISLTKLGDRACPFQTVFVGNKWSEDIENATHMVDSPVIILGPIQATVFAGVKAIVHYAKDDEEKLKQVLDLMGKIIATPTVDNKVIIVCQNNDIVSLVQKTIWEKFECSVLTVMHGNATDDDGKDVSPEQIEGVRQRWKTAPASSLQIIVCTDAVIKELRITDALQIIHFDLPENPLRFALRYCTMWSWFRSPEHRMENPADVKKITSNIFLTSKQKDLAHQIRKLKEMNCQIPEDLEIHFEKLRKEQETRFCPGLVWHGMCEQLDPMNCSHRHEALPYDGIPNPMIPRTGQIEVRIAETLNPSSYYVQLLRHFEINGTGKTALVCNYEAELLKREKFLEAFYENEENRVRPEKFQEDMFLAAEVEHKYVRAQIEAIVTKDSFNFPLAIQLFCLDTAAHITRHVNSDLLYVLPEGYDELPNFGVELVLANMKPPMGERCYRQRDHISKIARLANDNVLVGRICLSCGNRIWVDQLVEIATNEQGKKYQKRSLRQVYFRMKFAETNMEHMETLYKMFRAAGISCKEYEDLNASHFDPEFAKKFFQLDDTIQWAHLDLIDKENPNSVTLWSSFAKNVDVIFGYCEKFTSLLDSLNHELHQEIEMLRGTERHYHVTSLRKYYQAGMVVAAKDCDDKWARAIIDHVHSDEEEILVDLFFVDFGEDVYRVGASGLFPIPKRFVTKLPFQAIALKMSHIVPTSCDREEGERVWSQDAKDYIFDQIFCEDKAQKLEVVALSRNEKDSHEYPPCNHYNVMIFTSACPNELGKHIVMENYARFAEDGEKFVELIKQNLLEEVNATYDTCNKIDREESVSDGSDDSNLQDSNAPLLDPDELDRWDVYCGAAQDPLRMLMGENSHFDDYTQDVMKNMVKAAPLAIQSSASSRDTLESSSGHIREEKPYPSLSLTGADIHTLRSEPNLRKPDTVWKQLHGDICLRINIPDVKEYKAEVSEDRKSFYFETIDPPGYGFNLRLFKRVERFVDVKLLGSCTKIRLSKRMNSIVWTRLTENETRPRWITNDYDNISSDENYTDTEGSSSDEGKSRVTAVPHRKTKKKRKPSLNLMPVHFTDHESSSDSDFLQDDGGIITQYLE